MIASMTGFSCIEKVLPQGKLTIIIKSLNSRYLDLLIKIPEEFKPLESKIRTLISHKINRGKVECIVRYVNEENKILSIDDNFLSQLIEQSKVLSKNHNLPSVRIDELLKIPGVAQMNQPFQIEIIQSDFLDAINTSIDELISHRHQEGKYLAGLLDKRLKNIQIIVESIAKDYNSSTDIVRNKLTEKLQILADKYQHNIDNYRLEQEMVLALQKMDLSEEIDRLLGHVDKVKLLLSSKHPIGRKFDFLIQEMNRESNTIASKSQFLGITYNAVELKVLLEQMREQVQNIE